MTNQTIPPCPKCGVVPEETGRFRNQNNIEIVCVRPKCDHILASADYGGDCVFLSQWALECNDYLGSALRDLRIETVAQVRELVGIACDACDERTVRATNRAENLVPLLRRRAGEGWR